jgi:excisionase family DNA binding protein
VTSPGSRAQRVKRGSKATNLRSRQDGSAPLTASQLLTADQLAKRLQIPKQHVYRLTRAGQIPAVRLGKYYRYRIDAIEAWELEGGTE